jgi:hypothetical protein
VGWPVPPEYLAKAGQERKIKSKKVKGKMYFFMFFRPRELLICAKPVFADLEHLTKCLCIQAAYFPPGCVVGLKIVLDVALATPAAILALPPCRSGKTLTFDATTHFVRSS